MKPTTIFQAKNSLKKSWLLNSGERKSNVEISTSSSDSIKSDDVQFKKNVKMSEEWDSLYKKDKRELIQIFRSKVRVNNLSEREPKGEIVNAIMSERYYKQAWDYIPKSKR